MGFYSYIFNIVTKPSKNNRFNSSAKTLDCHNRNSKISKISTGWTLSPITLKKTSQNILTVFQFKNLRSTDKSIKMSLLLSKSKIKNGSLWVLTMMSVEIRTALMTMQLAYGAFRTGENATR